MFKIYVITYSKCRCILCVCRQRGGNLKYFSELRIQRKIISIVFKMYVITYN